MLSLESKQSGTVKFYNPTKGFGFIFADKEKKDIYFHITAINGASPPKVGDKVSFYLEEKKGRASACDVDITYIAAKTSFQKAEYRTQKTLQGFPCIRLSGS